MERHLQDGDYVVLNRQPSVNRQSIMGHRVRVMSGLSFRINTSLTTPYNVDFDGDGNLQPFLLLLPLFILLLSHKINLFPAMIMHVPQSLETMAEVKTIHLLHSPSLYSPPPPYCGVSPDFFILFLHFYIFDLLILYFIITQ